MTPPETASDSAADSTADASADPTGQTGGSARRRLAAIVYMDAVGYSKMMETDEAATLAALSQCRALAESTAGAHGGRLVSTAGDAFLLQFDSAVEAIDAARALQARLAERNRREADINRRMTFRMGVNVGDVVEQEGSLYGDGVNIAARLQAMAEPGGILTSANVIEQVADKLDLSIDDVGEISVKNIRRPIRAYRVDARTDHWPRRRWRPPAAGRGPISDFRRFPTFALALILGFFGVHRFYIGRTGTGLLMLVTLGGVGIWYLADIILTLTGELYDGQGRRVARW
jgi:class 3 adenylate cyclase